MGWSVHDVLRHHISGGDGTVFEPFSGVELGVLVQ